MIKTKLSRNQIRLVSFAVYGVLMLSVMCVRLYISNQSYKLQLEIVRQHAMTELCDSMDAITTSLMKSTYSASEETIEKLSSSLSGEARCAKIALSEISKDIYTDDIYKFLSQVGAYTNSITTKLSTGMSETDGENLSQLLDYSKSITQALEQVSDDYFDGSITFEESKQNLNFYSDEGAPLFSKVVSDLQESFTDYPTLIYDGPFSDHLGNTESVYLKNEKDVSKTEAQKYAAEILGVDESSLLDSGDEAGRIYLYCFSTDKKTVAITKKGCKLCYMINSAYAGEISLDEKAAMERGKDYLEKLGYKSMTSSYYSIYDGVCTVNYAYEEEGVICYPDLIKVSISLETGEIVGFDARSYLLNHKERGTDFTISRDEALKKISRTLDIIDVKKAVIPTDSEKEFLCYEFHCSDSQGNEALVYIDGISKEEREILILTYSDGGVLTK